MISFFFEYVISANVELMSMWRFSYLKYLNHDLFLLC